MTTTAPGPARLVLPADAPRDAWLAARRQGITATEIAALLGLSPYESAFSLYWRKLGELDEQADNDAMSLGRHLEPWVVDRFAEAHPELMVGPGGLYASCERPWQRATPDRLLYAMQCDHEPHCLEPAACSPPVAVLEIKTDASYDGWGDDGTDVIPVHYRAQVLWQLDVLGLTEARVACLFLHSRQIREYTIAYDPADVALLRNEAQMFLMRLERSDPPPIDAHAATTAALKALHPDVEDREVDVDPGLAADYAHACHQLKTAEQRKAKVENELRAALGTARTAVCNGEKVATRSVYERTGVDSKRLRQEWPSAYAACRTTSTVHKITPARKKATS